jgi:hypothetical protein
MTNTYRAIADQKSAPPRPIRLPDANERTHNRLRVGYRSGDVVHALQSTPTDLQPYYVTACDESYQRIMWEVCRTSYPITCQRDGCLRVMAAERQAADFKRATVASDNAWIAKSPDAETCNLNGGRSR